MIALAKMSNVGLQIYQGSMSHDLRSKSEHGARAIEDTLIGG